MPINRSAGAETTENGKENWDSVKVKRKKENSFDDDDGDVFPCPALTCPPLTKPANGSVSPASCAKGDAAPHQHCYFTCDPGFRVTGNPIRSCLPSLKWNPARPPPTCEKGLPFSIRFCLVMIPLLFPQWWRLGGTFKKNGRLCAEIQRTNNSIQVTVTMVGGAIRETPDQLIADANRKSPKKTWPPPDNNNKKRQKQSSSLFTSPGNLIHFTPGICYLLRSLARSLPAFCFRSLSIAS